MNDSSPTPIHDFVEVLRSQSLLIVVTVVFAVALALSLSMSQQESYRATASLAFDNLSQDFALVGSVGGAAEPPSALALRKAQTLLSTDTLEAATQRLDNRRSIAELRRQVTAAPEVTSNLVIITAEAGTAADASAIADAVANAAAQRETSQTRQRFSQGARELRRRYAALPASERADISTRTSYRERISRLDALASVASPVRLAERARTPTTPFSPRPVQAGIVACVVGLLLGVGLALVRNARDRRLRGSESIRTATNLPLIGQVREEAMGKAGMTAVANGGLSELDLEGFRILRANLEFLSARNDTKTLLITSPLPGEGKSTVAASLAWVSAMSGRRTLLVECDLRRPSLAPRLGLVAAPGLVELLSGDATFDDVLHVIPVAVRSRNGATPHPGTPASLDCIFAGRAIQDPAVMLGSDALGHFLGRSRAKYDILIIDSAPLLPVVDTLELFSSVDAALLCIRDSKTTRDQAAAARDMLSHLGDRPVGLVVTGLKQERSGGYGYYYSHSYDSH